MKSAIPYKDLSSVPLEYFKSQSISFLILLFLALCILLDILL